MLRSFLRRHHLFLINVTAATSLLGLGDFSVQRFYEKRQPVDQRRVYAACVTGAVMGVEGHVWYTFLDRWLVQNTWRNVFKKMLLDQIIAAPIYTLTYIVGTSLLEGRRSYEELKSDTQSSFLSLYLADCFVFMPIQIVNFKYIPAFYRVLFLSVVTFLFDAFISSYKHEHQDAHVDPK